MKDFKAGWVEPFYFTENQKSYLLTAIGNPKKDLVSENRAKKLIDRAEVTLKHWLTIVDVGKKNITPNDGIEIYEFDRPIQQTRPSEMKTKLEEVNEAVRHLEAKLKNLSVDNSTGLIAEADYLLLITKRDSHLTRMVKEYNELERKKHHSSSSAFYPLLFDLLSVVEKSSAKVVTVCKDKGGNYEPLIKLLVSQLAEQYCTVYKKKPAYSKGTKFVNFVGAVGELFSIQISADQIKSVLKK